MFLHYPNKQTATELYQQIPTCELVKQNHIESPNKLIMGNPLLVLKNLIEVQQLSNKIDVVYFAPPITHVVFAFTEDTTIRQKKKHNPNNEKVQLIDFLEALREKLFLIRVLLSERGAVYVRIDHRVGHYAKVLMDEIFGIENFRNDIAYWGNTTPTTNQLSTKEMILFYTKTPKAIWNTPRHHYTPQDVYRLFPKTDATGRHYTTVSLFSSQQFLNQPHNMSFKGIVPPLGQSWQADIATLSEWDKEGLIDWTIPQQPCKKIYYDSLTNLSLHEIWQLQEVLWLSNDSSKMQNIFDKILLTSSLPESYVLDCCCNHGEFLHAAHLLGRKWIGTDDSEIAIGITTDRLTKAASQTPLTYELLKALSQEDDEDYLRYMLTKFF